MLEFIIKYWMEWVFGIVAGGLTLAYRRLSKKVKVQKDENKAMKDGLKAILHDRLYQSCNYYIARGWIDTVGLTNFTIATTRWVETERVRNCITAPKRCPSRTATQKNNRQNPPLAILYGKLAGDFLLS